MYLTLANIKSDVEDVAIDHLRLKLENEKDCYVEKNTSSPTSIGPDVHVRVYWSSFVLLFLSTLLIVPYVVIEYG